MKNLLLLVFSFTIISCTTVGKKDSDQNQLMGIGSEDISSQDIDSDNKGSDSGTIEGLSTVYFAYDSSSLSEETKDILRQNIDWINNNSQVVSVTLEGHCDQMGSEAYNIGLGNRRAVSVQNFLVETGIQADKLSVISYGEERPFSDVDNAKNRRVNFVPVY